MNQLERFQPIKTFIFDVDGVLTNSHVLVLEDGRLLRQMSVRDGYAIKRAIQQGYRICVITGGSSEGVKKRLQGLGVRDVYLGQQDKIEAYEEYMDAYEIDPDTVLYMGDDLPDYPVMRKVGLPTCPKNAAPEVLALAKYISPYEGGSGCARDVIEKVMRLHGTWTDEEEED